MRRVRVTIHPDAAAMRASGHAPAPSAGLAAGREEVLEQHGRCAGVEIRRAAVSRFGRREALVVEINGKAQRGARVGEAPHALCLRPVLTTQRQGQTDDQSTYLLLRDQLTEACDVSLEVATRQRTERPREAERVITDRESDAAVTDVQGKIAHAQGGAAAVDASVFTSIRSRESKNGNRGHQPGHTVIVLSSSP